MRLWYPSIKACREEIFPEIHERLTQWEQAPDYERERRGADELQKIFALVRTRRYRTFHDKAAYIVCSIVTGHAFSNGNKRLGITVLLAFAIHNRTEVQPLTKATYQKCIKEIFPGYR